MSKQKQQKNNSLEQELLNAKLSINETNELFVIDRFASRKRDRISNVTHSSEKLEKKSYLKENDDASNEANFWLANI
jgi:hypothetical protein